MNKQKSCSQLEEELNAIIGLLMKPMITFLFVTEKTFKINGKPMILGKGL